MNKTEIMNRTIDFASFGPSELVNKELKKEVINIRALDNAVALWSGYSEVMMDKIQGDR